MPLTLTLFKGQLYWKKSSTYVSEKTTHPVYRQCALGDQRIPFPSRLPRLQPRAEPTGTLVGSHFLLDFGLRVSHR